MFCSDEGACVRADKRFCRNRAVGDRFSCSMGHYSGGGGPGIKDFQLNGRENSASTSVAAPPQALPSSTVAWAAPNEIDRLDGAIYAWPSRAILVRKDRHLIRIQ